MKQIWELTITRVSANPMMTTSPNDERTPPRRGERLFLPYRRWVLDCAHVTVTSRHRQVQIVFFFFTLLNLKNLIENQRYLFPLVYRKRNFRLLKFEKFTFPLCQVIVSKFFVQLNEETHDLKDIFTITIHRFEIQAPSLVLFKRQKKKKTL